MSNTDWRAAFDKQMELWSFWESRNGPRVAESYMRSVRVSGHGTTLDPEGLRAGQAAVMMHADPIVIDDDMMTLVENAAESFPPEALRPEDILTPVGFVWLPRPLVTIDANGKRLSFRAIAWGPVEYRIIADDSDGGASRTQTGLMMSYYSWHGDHRADDYDEEMTLFARLFNSDLSMSHWEPWMYGQTYSPRPDVPGGSMVGLRFTQTMWRLMQQTITTVTRERPGRASRRRAERMEMPERYVTVIRLRRPRRPAADDAEPREVEWTHRWLVSGHWRNQYFPSLGTVDDPTSHRVIWISPYTKGPDDLPLEVRRLRAFEWVQ